MNTQELRDYVRGQLEVDDEELPDRLLNVYLQDAFERTIAMDNRWPRNEKTWTVSKLVDQDSIALPSDMSIPSILSIVSVDQGYRIAIIAHENAEDIFIPNYTEGGGNPIYASFWAGRMYLWPKVSLSSSYDVQVRGYSAPVWSGAASDIPDMDPRLHIALAYYAIALTYAAQEDEVLEGVYMARWNRDTTQTIKTLMEPVHNHPLVLHGGNPVGGWPSYVVNLPEG